MRAVYLDESGNDNFYYFGALMVDAQSIQSIERGLNGIAALVAQNVAAFNPGAEFHGTDVFHGENDWKGVPVAWRVKASHLVSKVLLRSGAEFIWRGLDLKAHRERYKTPFPPHLLTLAQTLDQVDKRLARVHGDVGVVLADDHHTAAASRRNLVNFKVASVPGYTDRVFTNLADTIYFGPSHASRLIQAADMAMFFVNRHRTVRTGDPRALEAVSACAKRYAEMTVHQYVWAPRPWR